MISFRHGGPKISEEFLAGFEDELGVRLDCSYRNLLLSNNGGICSHGFPDNGTVCELVFYSLAGNDRGIQRCYSNLQEFCTQLLPVAGDMKAREYLLALNGDGFFIGEYIYPPFGMAQIGFRSEKIAGSFSEFVALLKPIDGSISLMEVVAKDGTPDSVDKFISAGNSIDAKGPNELSLICEAIKYDNVKVVEACANLNASFEGAVEIAAFNRNLEMVRLLVKLGADINEPNDEGKRPIDTILGRRYADVRSGMLQLGAIPTGGI